jgi:acetolactate synthase-1/2/3 large subunit
MRLTWWKITAIVLLAYAVIGGLVLPVPELTQLGIPVATTWNAVDYLDSDHPLYAGRPNTYGMRWANGVIQQADLVITLGARMGLQQTGFAWQEFVPVGNIVRIELDDHEIQLNQPKTKLDINMDAATGLKALLEVVKDDKITSDYSESVNGLDLQRLHFFPS